MWTENKSVQAALTCCALLDHENIPYIVTGRTALALQGVHDIDVEVITIAVQWDLLEKAAEVFAGYNPSAILERTFTFKIGEWDVEIAGPQNTVIATLPERLMIQIQDMEIPVTSVYHILKETEDPEIQVVIKAYLQSLQAASTANNSASWNTRAYDAWVKRFGTVEEAAQKIMADPYGKLGGMAKYLAEPAGKEIINLMGSNGTKAVALAGLGARATIVDISSENASYAAELAEAAGTKIDIVTADILEMPDTLNGRFDTAFMELGVLHYFVDLEPLFAAVRLLLKNGGRFIIQDFHPVSTKLIRSKGKKPKLDGNYFDQSLIETDVAFSKHLEPGEEEKPGKVYEKYWTLGEIITACAGAGFIIERLDEVPNTKKRDIGIPKIFTLVSKV